MSSVGHSFAPRDLQHTFFFTAQRFSNALVMLHVRLATSVFAFGSGGAGGPWGVGRGEEGREWGVGQGLGGRGTGLPNGIRGGR